MVRLIGYALGQALIELFLMIAVVAILIDLAMLSPRVYAQGNVPCPSVVSGYTPGNTYCITATGTSQIIIPNNAHRRYLLIQSESTTDAVYFAEAACWVATPLTAVVGTNTIQLPPQTPQANYEVSGLNQPNSLYLSAGAIAIITGGTSDTVCFKEMN